MCAAFPAGISLCGAPLLFRIQIGGQMAGAPWGVGRRGETLTVGILGGRTVTYVRAGATLPEAQQAGRWQSPAMPAHYARGELAAHGAVARLRHGN